MKYLIAGDRTLLRKGKFVKADEESGELIYDDETAEHDSLLTVDVLKAIAKANGISVGKANRDGIIAILTENLPKIENIPEQNKMSQSDIIKEIVTAKGAERKPGDDADAFEVEVFTECIQRLNKEGITFKIKQLGNLVKKEIQEQGLVVTNAQRKEQIAAILTEAEFKPETWDDVEAMIDRLVKEADDTDRKQALSAIRRYVKANEDMEMPKRTGKASKQSFRDRAIDYMIANSPVSEAEMLVWVVDEGGKKPDDAEKIVNRLTSLRETIDKAYAAGKASMSAESEAKAA